MRKLAALINTLIKEADSVVPSARVGGFGASAMAIDPKPNMMNKRIAGNTAAINSNMNQYSKNQGLGNYTTAGNFKNTANNIANQTRSIMSSPRVSGISGGGSSLNLPKGSTVMNSNKPGT